MKSHSESFLTIKDLPAGWIHGSYQNYSYPGKDGPYDYIDRGRFRAAVFNNFKFSGADDIFKGWGVFVFVEEDDNMRHWKLFGPLVKTHEEALHLMVAYAQLGAFDAHC